MIQQSYDFVVFSETSLLFGVVMNIDMRTVVFVSVLINAMCSIFIVKLWVQNRNRYNGLGAISLNFLFFTVALGLIVLRTRIPDIFSIVLANSFIYIGLLVGLMGFGKFAGLNFSKRIKIFNYISLVLVCFIQIFYTYAQPSLQARNLNGAIAMIVFCSQIIWILYFKAEPNLKKISKFLAFVFFLVCVISVFRIIDFFFGVHPSEVYFHSGSFQTFMFVSYQMLYVMLTYSIVLLVNQRLIGDILTQEKKFFMAFHSAPYAILLTRLKDGLIFDVNEGFQKITGFKKEEVLGKSTFDLNVWENDEDRAVFLKSLSEKGKIEGVDLRFITKKGEKLIGHVMADTIEINGEKCLLASIEDVTEKRKMYQVLQQTAKLDSLGILAGGIAHDFNNLLGGIFGYIDVARNRSQDTAVSGYLTKAINTIERARRLTLQLLTFAKGGAPRKKIGKLFPFIKETTEFALSGSNVACSFEYPQDLWMCDYDIEQLAQVVDNLVINAKQAMSKGGAISIKAKNIVVRQEEHPQLKKGNYVKIELSDSGKGIPEELISMIFDPFFTTKTHGHGLGLATSYSIINRHNGTIDVESQEGVGSIFSIYLPADSSKVDEPEEITTSKYVGNGTVLIMDDEEVIREILSDMLEVIGFDVIVTSDGNEAIEHFKKETDEGKTISCLIFDLTVPGGIGGKETVKEIRKINKTIPVFVASGYADDPAMSEPVKYGFTDSIPKPFTMKKLEEMLKKNL